MGNCGSSESAAAVVASNEIDKQLKLEQKNIQQNIKLLLLGPGETGKSTVLKQFKLIYGEGYTANEKLAFRTTILTNVMTCTLSLINAMDMLKIPYGVDAAKVVKSFDMSFGISPGETLPDEIVGAVEVVWKDPGIQYCFSRANEYQLVDCCGYFLNRAKEVCNPEYNPTEQDILNTRQMTTTVSETRIMVEKKIFRIFDVGGQRGERKKWAPYFDDVDAIIYLVAISSYDQVCLEDSSTNRMVESMNLFDSICNHPLFKMTEMIVFMNKIDLFKEKLEKQPISQYFPTYQGPNTYESCSEYFASRFIALNLFPEKSIYLHFTWATDTKQIKAVLAIVNHSILRGNLTKAGL
ncbi:guanine nucleotide binding protein, alpha subunit [Obelidium mucronatum]|nr:guanine nucleotide binding protein, alpha subunit [Obelidium mucronatum]